MIADTSNSSVEYQRVMNTSNWAGYQNQRKITFSCTVTEAYHFLATVLTFSKTTVSAFSCCLFKEKQQHKLMTSNMKEMVKVNNQFFNVPAISPPCSECLY